MSIVLLFWQIICTVLGAWFLPRPITSEMHHGQPDPLVNRHWYSAKVTSLVGCLDRFESLLWVPSYLSDRLPWRSCIAESCTKPRPQTSCTTFAWHTGCLDTSCGPSCSGSWRGSKLALHLRHENRRSKRLNRTHTSQRTVSTYQAVCRWEEGHLKETTRRTMLMLLPDR